MHTAWLFVRVLTLLSDDVLIHLFVEDEILKSRLQNITVQNYQRDALNIIYSSNITLLYSSPYSCVSTRH